MRARIPCFYFTAFGTTEYIAQLVREGTRRRNIELDLIQIKKIGNFPFPDFTRENIAIGIAFPVYEFMIPRIMLVWLHQLPLAPQKTPTFVITTSGGLSCNAAGVACDLLRAKNYLPVGILEVPTPILEPFFRQVYYPAGWCPEILDRCFYFGRILAKRLIASDYQFVNMRLGHFRLKFLSAWADRYIRAGGSTASGFITYKANLCNRCGACVRSCPMRAIDLDHSPSPIRSNRCMLCSTCVRVCPSHALQILHRGAKKPPARHGFPQSLPGHVPPEAYRPSPAPSLNQSLLYIAWKMQRHHRKRPARS